MIEPGQITLELLLDAKVYLILLIFGTLLIGAFAAFVADRMADERKRTKIKEEDPTTNLSEVYDIESDWISVGAGIVAVIIMVWPAMDKIDQAFGIFALFSWAALVGYGARQALPFLSERLLTKMKEAK